MRTLGALLHYVALLPLPYFADKKDKGQAAALRLSKTFGAEHQTSFTLKINATSTSSLTAATLQIAYKHVAFNGAYHSHCKAIFPWI